jgi:hypothetical protein
MAAEWLRLVDRQTIRLFPASQGNSFGLPLSYSAIHEQPYFASQVESQNLYRLIPH